MKKLVLIHQIDFTWNVKDSKIYNFTHCVENLLKYLFHKGMNVISNCKKVIWEKYFTFLFVKRKKMNLLVVLYDNPVTYFNLEWEKKIYVKLDSNFTSVYILIRMVTKVTIFLRAKLFLFVSVLSLYVLKKWYIIEIH